MTGHFTSYKPRTDRELATHAVGRVAAAPDLDDAFARRFQVSVRFSMPDAAARLRLWTESFHGLPIASDVEFRAVAARHELAGGAIINVLRHAALMAAARHPPNVRANDIIEGVRQELRKDGRSIEG